MLKEAVGLMKGSGLAARIVGEPFEGTVRPSQIAGPKGGPGIYQTLGPSGELRGAVNVPLEESDLGKLTDEEISKKLPGMHLEVKQYKEGSSQELRGGRQELWAYLLGFLLLVLAAEMGVANKL